MVTELERQMQAFELFCCIVQDGRKVSMEHCMSENIDKAYDLVVCSVDFVYSLNGNTPESALSLLALVCMRNLMVSRIKSICIRCLCGMNESILNFRLSSL